MVLSRFDGSGEIQQVTEDVTKWGQCGLQIWIVAIIGNNDTKLVLRIIQVQTCLDGVEDDVNRLLAGGNNQVNAGNAFALGDVYLTKLSIMLGAGERCDDGDS